MKKRLSCSCCWGYRCGRAKIIELLENEMKFNIVEVTLLSSKRSAGKKVRFKGREIIIKEAKTTSFEGVDIAFLALGRSI